MEKQIKDKLKAILELFSETSLDLNSIESTIENIKNLEQIKFITSLSIIENDKVNKDTEIILSTNFFFGNINYEEIMYNLKNNTHGKEFKKELYIVVVSWQYLLENLNTEERNGRQVYSEKDAEENICKIHVQTIDYKTFFENVRNIKENFKTKFEKKNNKQLIGLNPIIIFQGLH